MLFRVLVTLLLWLFCGCCWPITRLELLLLMSRPYWMWLLGFEAVLGFDMVADPVAPYLAMPLLARALLSPPL
ncbi:hypothetical protein BKA57DRAFT_147987 [Linnemannia elongata]|nr:hypothetical protein BKA57DRAFT_147987 [Linnemannia elongata]